MENVSVQITHLLITSVAVTQGKHPLLLPIWELLVIVSLIPLSGAFYLLTLFILNRTQEIYLMELRFPRIIEEENEHYIDKMRSVFATLHSISRSQIDKVCIEVMKTDKYITIHIGSNKKEVLEKAKSIFAHIRNIQLLAIKKDKIMSINPLYTRTIATVKEFYPITKEAHFFDNLLGYLSSLSDSESAGVQIIFRGVNKNEHIQRLRNKISLKALQQKRRQMDSETYLHKLYQEKQISNMFKVRINIFANKRTLLSNLTALMQSLNFAENIFFSRGIRKRSVLKRFIAPDTVLSNFHDIRKIEGSYLTSNELAYFIHPTSYEPGNYAAKQTKNIEASPQFLEECNENILIGHTQDQDRQKKNIYFPIKNFARHVYIIGKTGRGKSTLLVHMITGLLKKTTATVFVFDPHGDLLEDILKVNDSERYVYLNIADKKSVFTINPGFCFGKSDNEKASRLDGLLDIIKNETQELAGNTTSGVATFQRIKQMLTILIEFPDAYYSYLTKERKMNHHAAWKIVHERQLTLNDVPHLLIREMDYIDVIQEIFKYTDSDVGIYVAKLYESHTKQHMVAEAVQTRLEQLLHPSLRLIYEGNKFNIEKLTVSGKTFLIPLPETVYGSHGSRALLQSMFFLIWEYKRRQKDQRKDTYVFIDEFQKAQINDISEIIAEGRKFKLYLTVSNQQLGQLKQTVKDAIFGNIGTVVSFTVSADKIGAKTLAPYFGNGVTENELIQLPPHVAYMKTEGDNTKPLATFSFETIQPEYMTEETQNENSNTNSLDRYGEPIEVIKERLRKKQKNPLEYFLGDV